MLFEVKPIDQQKYKEEIKDFVPDKIIDIHTHLWLEPPKSHKHLVSWPLLVAKTNSLDELLTSYQLFFPEKIVIPMIFASLLTRQDDFEEGNNYINREAQRYNLPALLFTRPDWSAEKVEKKLLEGKFLGIKVMLSLASEDIPPDKITIFDYLPYEQLEIINKHGLIVMLHIPRKERLKDPVNLKQMIEIEETYPNVQLIIAHVGRAYCDTDVGTAFSILSKTEKMTFDIAANTNSNVFRQLIETVGSKRILFGSDLPVARMRMKRLTQKEPYINLVPKGLYGDLTGIPHMQEIEGKEAENLTFFLYEEILAFKKAAQETKLTHSDIEDVFFNNAKRIIENTGILKINDGNGTFNRVRSWYNQY